MQKLIKMTRQPTKCYKLIQLFRVTCFIAGQYNTDLLWHIAGII